MTAETTISAGTARAFTIPTDGPEADGTIAWNSTTLIVVELAAGATTGIGYSYGHRVSASVARELIHKHLVGHDSMETNALFAAMRTSQRNYGAEGIGATALSALDIALWDLKARVINVPLATLLGTVRKAAPVYGSGGFTSYTDAQLREQLAAWIGQGIPRVKMKIGTHPEQDARRMAAARQAIGADAELFIDANGAFSRKQALYFAELARSQQGVTWFEEPVSSDDLAGLRLLRDRVPPGMDIAAGEYGWNSMYLARMIRAEAVDVIQADATRYGGVTGFMEAAAIAIAHPIPLSAHCAPNHSHASCVCSATGFDMSNISTTMFASNQCFLMDFVPRRPTDACIRISPGQVLASNSRRLTPRSLRRTKPL